MSHRGALAVPLMRKGRPLTSLVSSRGWKRTWSRFQSRKHASVRVSPQPIEHGGAMFSEPGGLRERAAALC